LAPETDPGWKKRRTKFWAGGLIFAVLVASIGGIIWLTRPEGVRFQNVVVLKNTGIGNDWQFQVWVNGKSVSKHQFVALDEDDYPCTIRVRAIEVDKYSDVGEKTLTIREGDSSSTHAIDVVVMEDRGRGAGGGALVRFTFSSR
jgi:hypothetical protein